MSDYKFGQVDWNEGQVSNGSNEFMKLEQGNNVVRVFTLPYQFQVCWVKDASGASKKLRTAFQNCPLIKRGEKPQTRWMLGVLNRKTGQAEILEIGSQIYKGIKTLNNDEKWGNPRTYDVNIKKGKPGEQPLYGVIAYPPQALTVEEEALIEEFSGSTDLKKFTAPPTPAEVQEKMAELLGVVVGGSAPKTVAPIDDSTFNFDE